MQSVCRLATLPCREMARRRREIHSATPVPDYIHDNIEDMLKQLGAPPDTVVNYVRGPPPGGWPAGFPGAEPSFDLLGTVYQLVSWLSPLCMIAASFATCPDPWINTWLFVTGLALYFELNFRKITGARPASLFVIVYQFSCFALYLCFCYMAYRVWLIDASTTLVHPTSAQYCDWRLLRCAQLTAVVYGLGIGKYVYGFASVHFKVYTHILLWGWDSFVENYDQLRCENCTCGHCEQDFGPNPFKTR